MPPSRGLRKMMESRNFPSQQRLQQEKALHLARVLLASRRLQNREFESDRERTLALKDEEEALRYAHASKLATVHALKRFGISDIGKVRAVHGITSLVQEKLLEGNRRIIRESDPGLKRLLFQLSDEVGGETPLGARFTERYLRKMVELKRKLALP